MNNRHFLQLLLQTGHYVRKQGCCQNFMMFHCLHINTVQGIFQAAQQFNLCHCDMLDISIPLLLTGFDKGILGGKNIY